MTVGDTFEYNINGGYAFQKYVITGVNTSPDSTTRLITRKLVSATNNYNFYMSDTVRVDSLQQFEIVYDSINFSSGGITASVSTPNFFNSKTNSVSYPRGSICFISALYAKGLGDVDSSIRSPWKTTTTQLYHYSGIRGTYGVTFWGYTTSIDDVVNEQKLLCVQDEPKGNSLKIVLMQGYANISFCLYDMQGRIVRNASLEDFSTELSIADLRAGVYLWKASGANNTEQHGRIVKE